MMSDYDELDTPESRHVGPLFHVRFPNGRAGWFSDNALEELDRLEDDRDCLREIAHELENEIESLDQRLARLKQSDDYRAQTVRTLKAQCSQMSNLADRYLIERDEAEARCAALEEACQADVPAIALQMIGELAVELATVQDMYLEACLDLAEATASRR